MRKHKWAVPELSDCPYYMKEPDVLRGRWRTAFADESLPLYLELGAGKCGFGAEHCLRYPDVNLLLVDKITDILGVGRRNIEKRLCGEIPPNLRLATHEIERIGLMLGPEDSVARIYINFCNPWPKSGDWKKRLTHPRQLAAYRQFLADGGEVHFKTDDDMLFAASLRYFEQSGFRLAFVTNDLHADGRDNILTEHERMFSGKGIKIKMLIAEKASDIE